MPPGNAVVQLTATDNDNDPITLRITAATFNGGDFFFLANDTIFTRVDLRQTTRDTYRLDVQASDNRGGIGGAVVVINIRRLPTDRPPVFSENIYRTSINKYLAPLTSLINTSASDPDIPNNPERIKYELATSPDSLYFSINEDTGEITLNLDLTLDTFNPPYYTLELYCYDEQHPNNRGKAYAIINVDFNPNRPVFVLTSAYTRTISEYFPDGMFVLSVNATDADGDVIRYYIQDDVFGQSARKFFSISPFSGDLIKVGDLTQTSTNQFRFFVVAFDDGRPQKIASTTVIINILRDNSAPSCTNLGARTIDENAFVNTSQPIFTFSARDQDNLQSATFVYAPTGNNVARTFFRVEPTGQVFVNVPLTLTSQNVFQLEALVYTDGFSQNPSVCRVSITVRRNLNPPRFSTNTLRISVFEYETIGYPIVRMNATDADGDTLRYYLTSNNNGLTYFAMNDLTGQLSIRTPLSEGVANQYQVTVIATDNRSPSQSGQATVTIDVVRDILPQFVNFASPIQLDEADSRGKLVTNVTATDSNLIGRIAYELQGRGSASSIFTMNPNTGVITLLRDLNTTYLDASYTLNVYAYDTALPQARAMRVLVVNVIRNQFEPVFINIPYVYSISVDSAVRGVVIGNTISATDRDGDICTYTMEATGNSAQYILLNSVSGTLYLIGALRNLPSTQTSFVFNVVATDRPIGGRTARQQVEVRLVRDQSDPRFTQTSYTVTIPETQLVNTTVLNNIRATDPDPQGSMIYEIAGIYPGPDFFRIETAVTSASLVVDRDLRTDSLASPSYLLRVIAYGSSNPASQGTATVTVFVTRNPSFPQFPSGTINAVVSQTRNPGYNVINITATDADGDNIIYRFTRDLDGKDGLNYFFIDPNTGVVKVQNPLTTTNENRYRIEVQATDDGNPEKSRMVELIISIQRIACPSFSLAQYQTSIEENRPIGQSVFRLTATNPTVNGDLRYEAIGNGFAPYLFTINSTTGLVTIGNGLRGFQEMQYTLVVNAYDTAYPSCSGETRLVISVSRNDNPPVFTNSVYLADVTVNTPIYSTLVTVNASDPVDGDSITYEITGPPICLNNYRILPISGQFLLTADPSTLQAGQTDCTIRAIDNGYPAGQVRTATVRVRVTQENIPVFTGAPYVRQIDEKQPVGWQVIQVIATKPGLTGEIRYSLEDQYPANTFFAVNSTTGAITILTDLRNDPLKRTEYILNVCAVDTAYPSIEACQPVRVRVNRNEFGPQFFPDSLQFPLSETTTPNSWSRILNVTDPDSGSVKCSIIANVKAQEFFQVDADTCVLSLKRPLTDDPDRTTRYEVHLRFSQIDVQARDNGQPPKTDVTRVTVDVARDLFNPSFTNLDNTIQIPETSVVGGQVFQATVTDQDRQGQLVCVMVATPPASIYFNVSTDCRVNIRSSVRFDNSNEYVVPIQVYDTVWPNNRMTGVLTVRVNRNPNAPIFVNNLEVTINDNTALGTTVISITANDLDNDVVTFSKVDVNDPDGDNFFVVSTGEIVLVRPLSGQASYTFSVAASDNRVPPSVTTAVVTINVIDATFSPVWEGAPFSATINMDQNPNSPVNANVRATKRNTVNKIRYRLTGSAPAGAISLFDINTQSGVLTLLGVLATSPVTTSRTGVVLFVEAYDMDVPGEVIQTYVTINFLRNMNPPTFPLTQLSTTIYDFDDPGTNVETLTATDGDPLPPEKDIYYSLQQASEWFTVDTFTGVVAINKRVSEDLLKPTRYILNIVAKDSSLNPLSATATLTVNVRRNRPPVFSQNRYTADVSDASDIFSPFIVTGATDPDVENPNTRNGEVQYYIQDSEAAKIFTINSTTGAISARRSLENLPLTEYTFTVRAEDAGIPNMFDTAVVVLTIVQSPGISFFPTFSIHEVNESTAIGYQIERVQANDGGANTKILYEIRGDGDADKYFEIDADTGVLRVKANFTMDNSQVLSYKVRVRAYRQSDPQVEAYKEITVNVNRNPTDPRFTQRSYVFTIPENQPLGFVFNSVSATDPDQGSAGILTYSIDKTSNSPIRAYVYFYINPNNGDLSVSQSLLDGRSFTNFSFPVTVHDNGSPQQSDVVQVTIIVERNAHAPEFSVDFYNVDITENTTVNSQIIRVRATDQDINDKVTFTLAQQDIGSLFFQIDAITGWITLKQSVLRSSDNVYRGVHFPTVLTVTASDNQQAERTAEAFVTINIIRNPNSPIFADKNYVLRISEYHDLTSEIVRVIATDADDPNSDSGRLRYTIVNQTATMPNPPQNNYATDFFIVGENSGALYLDRPLTTLLAADAYDIYITAEDSAVTPKTDITKVSVTIVRNQYAPVFTAANYNRTIPENYAINQEILRVTATDNDSLETLNRNTPNVEIQYSLKNAGTGAARFFGINNDGSIYKRSHSDKDGGSESFLFYVVARDMNWKGDQSNEILVNITIDYIAVLEGALGFTQPIYYLDLKENHPVGEEVLVMNVENQGDNLVNCAINNNGNSDLDQFFAGPDSDHKNCVIRTNAVLDREHVASFDFNVSVTARNSRKKRQAVARSYVYNTWVNARVIINLIDINDNYPVWTLVDFPKNNLLNPDGTAGIFITAIDYQASAARIVTQLTATDIDAGLNGQVTYKMDENSYFNINPDDGTVFTIQEFTETDKSQRFLPFLTYVEARDNSITGYKANRTECYINLVRPENRFVMVIANEQMANVVARQEELRIAMQAGLQDYVVLIEKIEAKRIETNNNGIQIRNESTDVTFLVGQAISPYTLIRTDDPVALTILGTTTSGATTSRIISMVNSNLKVTVENVRMPFTSLILPSGPTKSYVWWMDDPWAALIAMAAIIILLAIVGIIVIIFTHSRYMKFIQQYRAYQATYDNPDFAEPPGFLREYETQSLEMYVPPEAVPDYGEVRMTMDETRVESVTHAGQDSRVVAAVNPIYTGESSQMLTQTMTTTEVTTTDVSTSENMSSSHQFQSSEVHHAGLTSL